MRNIACILIFFMSIPLVAQDWEADYAVAISNAKAQNKPLVLVFSGSDWCASCIKLDREIWQSETFKAYSKEHYVLYRADFPRKKPNQLSEQKISVNKQLADKFNSKGYFPHVVVLTPKEEVLGTLGYLRVSPNDYISKLNSFRK